MGYASAAAFAAAAPLDTALHWHLTANHYPPLPATLVPVAKRAVEKAQRGEWDASVRLPKGWRFRGGSSLLPVATAVKVFHLDAFLASEEED